MRWNKNESKKTNTTYILHLETLAEYTIENRKKKRKRNTELWNQSLRYINQTLPIAFSFHSYLDKQYMLCLLQSRGKHLCFNLLWQIKICNLDFVWGNAANAGMRTFLAVQLTSVYWTKLITLVFSQFLSKFCLTFLLILCTDD